MPPANNKFSVRSAASTTNDAEVVLAIWDSTLPYLESIGAGEMWGTEPFSQREGQRQEIQDIISSSEKDPQGPQGDTRRLLIAEADTHDDVVQAGAAIIRDALPNYLIQRNELQNEIQIAKSLLFIEVLISDRRPSSRADSTGAGAALVEAVKCRAREAGKDVVYVDAWAGNGRKLNQYVENSLPSRSAESGKRRYYKGLGFQNVGDFSITKRNGSTWPGTLYCVDLK